jgi:hypothetical protein
MVGRAMGSCAGEKVPLRPLQYLLQQYLAAQPDATLVNASDGAGGVRLIVGFGEEHDEHGCAVPIRVRNIPEA